MTADHTTIQSAGGVASASAEGVDRPHARALHRLVCLYSTSGLNVADATGTPIVDVMDLGRFAGHYAARPDVPVAVGRGVLAPDAVRWRGAAAEVDVRELEAYVLRLRRGRALLALRIEFAGPLRDAIPLLRESCFDRHELTVLSDGRELDLFDALLAVAPSGASKPGADGGFDRDVHQVLCAAAGVREFTPPGGALEPPIRAALARYVYRSDEDFRIDFAAFRLPHELNRGAGSAAAHGRGVTVLSGIAEPVENAAILTAAQLLSAAAALRETRRRAEQTLKVLTAVRRRKVSLSDRREVLAALSNELSEMQTELSFGVETQIDAVYVPEIVVEQYQSSLVATLGLGLAAETTSKMLDRLTAAIAATSEALERLARESDDDRRDRVTRAFGVVSMLAIPLTLLLAFYGVNSHEVNGSLSVVNLHYWRAWLIVAALTAAAFLYVRRLGRRGSDRGDELETVATNRLEQAQARVELWQADDARPAEPGVAQPQVRT